MLIWIWTAVQAWLSELFMVSSWQYGKGSVMKLGDNVASMNVETFPTGSLSLDLALGLGGKMKYYGEQRSTSSYDAVDRFDGGLRLGCGLEYQMLYAEAGFDFGIANIGDSDFDGVHTRSFFINVGVNF